MESSVPALHINLEQCIPNKKAADDNQGKQNTSQIKQANTEISKMERKRILLESKIREKRTKTSLKLKDQLHTTVIVELD